jgi:hypothetical protein
VTSASARKRAARTWWAARWVWVLLAPFGSLALCGAAWASPAQGYSITLTPALVQGQQWLLVLGAEQSDPNTQMQTGAAPSMRQQRHWWLLFDAAGRARCSVRSQAAQLVTVEVMSKTLAAHLRAGCPELRSTSSLWVPARWTAWTAGPEAKPDASWSHKEVCVAGRCVAGQLTQHTLRGAASERLTPPATAWAAAPARCVAGRWLLVSNSDDGNGASSGARFVGLPPPLRDDIVGYEFVAIDAVVALPAGLQCGA